jgi:cytochrome c553
MTRRQALGLLVLALLPASNESYGGVIDDKAAPCAACHGENGVPINKSFPAIWGQNEGYIYIELRDMKKGLRKNEPMAPIVEKMDRDDMLALASYFASKPWPNLAQPRASVEDANRFAVMANSGQCPACHQAGYIGAGTQPRLAGQSFDYLLKTMMDFRKGERGNSDWMTTLLRTYSDDDIQRMVRVLSGM